MREPQGKNKAKENFRIRCTDRGEKQSSESGFMPLNLHSELTAVIDLTQAASITRGFFVFHVTFIVVSYKMCNTTAIHI